MKNKNVNVNSNELRKWWRTIKFMNYKLLSHTADIGIQAKGKNFSSALKNTILGMLSLTYDLKNVTAKNNIILKIEENDLASWVVKSLNKVLNIIQIKKFLIKKVKVNIVKDKMQSKKKYIQIILTGEKINLNKHNIFKEIKSATYHKLSIYKRNGVSYIKVYFDV